MYLTMYLYLFISLFTKVLYILARSDVNFYLSLNLLNTILFYIFLYKSKYLDCIIMQWCVDINLIQVRISESQSTCISFLVFILFSLHINCYFIIVIFLINTFTDTFFSIMYHLRLVQLPQLGQVLSEYPTLSPRGSC